MIEVQATFTGIAKGAQEEAKVTVDGSPLHRWEMLSFLFYPCLILVLYSQSSAQMCFRNHFQATMGRGFESCSRRHAGTLGKKSFTRSCLWHFGMKRRHSIRAVSGVPRSSRGLEEAI